ncbi:MAG TPA: hypothetical protein ACFCUD_05510 [Cyclobacteriaceae bacterium]
MIYVSSSCVKSKFIEESIETLVENGFKNIELSGGTRFSDSIEDTLLRLKKKYYINFLAHNYFPPPKNDFVLNLASLDPKINQLSLDHIKNSITLSDRLNLPKFAFHAGFLINIPLNQIGKEIRKQKLSDKTKAINSFTNNVKKLQSLTDNVMIYIENNVLSKKNYQHYYPYNPFLFTDQKSFEDLRAYLCFTPLLDVAHLKVSCQTLKLNFQKQLEYFLALTDYVHISDNDGSLDSNGPLIKNSELYSILSYCNLSHKTYTLEVYSGIDDLKISYNNLEELIHAK